MYEILFSTFKVRFCGWSIKKADFSHLDKKQKRPYEGFIQIHKKS